MKRKIVFDCDNTMGIKNCDVDDGLALLILLASDKIDLLAITSTFGNSKTNITFNNTRSMLKDIKKEYIPVYKGGSEAGKYESEASKYLAYIADKHKGELEIVATGSLTNIAGAFYYDPNFYNNIKAIYLMGGITKSLIFAKRKMNELNFSIDNTSSFEVLTNIKNIHILTGNNCLKVLFTIDEFKKKLKDSDTGKYILEKSLHWFEYNEDIYGIGGFYNWDASIVMYLLHHEIFEDNINKFNLNKEDLKKGFLRQAEFEYNAILNLPSIKEEELFKNKIYEYLNFNI